jgi:hypothetical protein
MLGFLVMYNRLSQSLNPEPEADLRTLFSCLARIRATPYRHHSSYQAFVSAKIIFSICILRDPLTRVWQPLYNCSFNVRIKLF